MARIETDDFIVSYPDDAETQRAVFDRVVAFFKEHEAFHGESIMQSDNPQIYAPVLLSEIADDLLKFDVKWKDD